VVELRGSHGTVCARSPNYLTCWGTQNIGYNRALVLKR
jgi:hypothetical protein